MPPSRGQTTAIAAFVSPGDSSAVSSSMGACLPSHGRRCRARCGSAPPLYASGRLVTIKPAWGNPRRKAPLSQPLGVRAVSLVGLTHQAQAAVGGGLRALEIDPATKVIKVCLYIFSNITSRTITVLYIYVLDIERGSS
jgi:hypothetical protein